MKVRGDGTICVTSPGCAREASSISRASAALAAIRASVSTCLPASRAAMVSVRCIYGQVPMQTALMDSSSRSSCQLSYTLGMLNWSATTCPDARDRFATAAISTPSTPWKPGMCRSRVFRPAPMSPIRISSFGMVILLVLKRRQQSLTAVPHSQYPHRYKAKSHGINRQRHSFQGMGTH